MYNSRGRGAGGAGGALLMTVAVKPVTVPASWARLKISVLENIASSLFEILFAYIV